MPCGYIRISLYEPFTIVPNEAVGGCKPKPIKLSNASVKIAPGIVNVVATIIGPRIFGSICLQIKRWLLAPNVLEARINSCPFNFNVCPRTILAIPIHPAITIASVMDMIPGFKTRINMILIIRPGIPTRISTKRCMTLSKRPP